MTMKKVYTLIMMMAMMVFASMSCSDTFAGENNGDDTEQPGGQDPDDGSDDDPDTEEPVSPEPDRNGDGIVKILAIGNSFSQDAVEQYLWDLFDAAGIDAVIGNLYIGGCRLETHYKNMKNDNPAYAYRKVVDGKKSEKSNFTMAQGIADENWDYISLQQASGISGKYETYTPYLPELVEYVRTSATNPAMALAFHQTWAYASNSDHSEFSNYGKDQMTMYEAIMSAVKQAAADNDIEIVIPSGTAIQNGRNSFIGDAFNRDGYHLEVNYGRYTAACTWFEKISGISAVGNAYFPTTVDPAYAEVAQNAAHFAVLDPYEVNPMTDFQKPQVTTDGKTPVYIDFGSSRATSWNNIPVYEISGDDKPQFLKDASGAYTGMTISAMEGFTGMNDGVGSEPKDQDIVIDGFTWLRDAWVDGIAVTGTKGNGNVGPATVTFSGLDPATAYDFSILSVRYNGSDGARNTVFTITGASESEPVTLDQGMTKWTGTGLDRYRAVFEDVVPAADGTVVLSVVGVDTGRAAEGNLNAMTISW